ncbi:hypothetical protein GCM10027446_03050 [Angustibacter peucedani]
MDLEAVVDELYGLPGADFTARRDEVVAQARAAKDTALVKAVRELRKPTASAALVNRLAREAADVLEDYLDLGERLRAAQSRLAGDQLRALGQERQRAAAALVKRAVALAGGSVSATVQNEVDATLRAAVADPAAAQAVASGRLTRGLSYAGLGEVDITAATATPVTSRPRPAPEPEPDEPDDDDTGGQAADDEPVPEPEPEPEPARRRPARGDGVTVLAQRRDRAEHELDQAQADVRAAREAAELAASAAQEAVATQRDAEQEVDDLRERLAQARFAVRQAQQEVASTQAARQSAERAVTAAEKAYGKAKHRRDLLGDDS